MIKEKKNIALFGAISCFSILLALVVVRFVFALTWTHTLLLDTYWPPSFSIDYNTGSNMTIVMESDTKAHMYFCQDYRSHPVYQTVENGVAGTAEVLKTGTYSTGCFQRQSGIVLDGTTPVAMFPGTNLSLGIVFAVRDGNGLGDYGCTDSNWSCYNLTSTINVSDFGFEKYGSTFGLAFQDITGGLDELMYAYCSSGCTNSTSWTYEYVDSDAAPDSLSTDLDFLSNGTPVIAYTDASGFKVKYAIRDGGGSGNCTDLEWNCYDIDDTITTDHILALAINSNDQIGVVYPEVGTADPQYALKVGSGGTGCNGDQNSQWTCESIGGTSSNMSFPDIKYSNTIPLVSWYDAIPDDLYFAYKSTSTWSNEIVVSTGNIGSHTSIDYFGDQVGLGYKDETNQEAMYAQSTLALSSGDSGTSGGEGNVSTTVQLENSAPDLRDLELGYTSTTSDITNAATTSSVDLIEGTTTTIYAHGWYADYNGCDDLTGSFTPLVGFIARDDQIAGLSEGSTTYPTSSYGASTVASGDCEFASCDPSSGDLNGTFSCSFDMYYFADNTTTESPKGVGESHYWVAKVTGEDNALLTDTVYATFEVNLLTAVDIGTTINYGAVDIAATSTEKTLEITNTGNDNTTDLDMRGTDMTCTTGTIDVSEQRYSATPGAYGASLTSGSSSTVDFNLAKQTTIATLSTSSLYWTLHIPTPTGGDALAGTCTGTTTIYGTAY
ncbi:MAG: hypothetical protein ABII02_00035 [Candidatus Magasanikbacteria bacterium]